MNLCLRISPPEKSGNRQKWPKVSLLQRKLPTKRDRSSWRSANPGPAVDWLWQTTVPLGAVRPPCILPADGAA
jgi:hypothetical protein